jgi:hypothetical protein
MTAPVTLSNIIWYGFFTTDLKVVNDTSITSIPSNFAYEINNFSGNLGIATNAYLQNTFVYNNNITTEFLQLKDGVVPNGIPKLITFTATSSFTSNDNNSVVYNNNVIVTTNEFKYLISSDNSITYPESSFYINIDTSDINLTEYIEKYKRIEFPDTQFAVESIQNYIGFSTDRIQINIGLGNIDKDWVGNTNVIYNPYLPNIYNNYKSYGNANSNGWIIFSTNYPTIN